MLDSVNLERMGVPTVTVVTEPFVPAAEAAARSLSLPDLPMVVVPHDYLNETDEDIRKKLGIVLDDLIEKLLVRATA